MMPGLLALGLLTLVFNLGGGVIAPALPLYARSLGADYRDLGVIGAAHGLAFAALTVPLGRASDRFGRRALLVLSALAIGGAAGCYLVSTGVSGLVVGKLLEAAGWAAFWPALEAWVAETFGRRAGTAMGVGYGAYAAAFMAGTAAAGFVIEGAGLRAPFGVCLGTSAVAAALILALPATRAQRGAEGATVVRHEAARATPQGDRRPRLLAYGTGFVYVYGLGTVLAFLPAYAADRGLAPSAVGLCLGIYWMGRLVASLGAGRLSDRLGRRAILSPAMLIGVIAAALLAWPTGPPALLFLGALGLGLTAGACAPTCVGLIADNVRAADRGFAMGLFEGACGLAFILAGLAGGHAADALGPGTPYLLVAALSLAWMPVLARGLPRLTPGSARS